MNHGINNSFLYSACRILTTFSNGINVVTMRGTGFFIKTSDSFYLITNRHVVDITFKDQNNQYVGYQLTDFSIDNRRTDPVTTLPTNIIDIKIVNHNEFIFPQDDKNDIACLKNIKAVGDEPITIDCFIPIEMIATNDKICTRLSVCDFVAFPGFPDWYDQRNNNPILRTGSIASDPRFDYSVTKEFMGNCIAFEAFSFGGSSGSPIYAIQKGFQVGDGLKAGSDFFREVLLIGINAGHFDTSTGQHSGISYFYKSSEILKLINQ